MQTFCIYIFFQKPIVEFALAFQKFAQKKTLAMAVVPFQVGQ